MQELLDSLDISFRRSVPDRRNHQAKDYSTKRERKRVEEILDLGENSKLGVKVKVNT